MAKREPKATAAPAAGETINLTETHFGAKAEPTPERVTDAELAFLKPAAERHMAAQAKAREAQAMLQAARDAEAHLQGVMAVISAAHGLGPQDYVTPDGAIVRAAGPRPEPPA